ncbi:hypothetical protein CERZMDRAFT_103108 [Cercospora zeae-maydis SCOH1-5]|uniref:Cupin 2 conserved barrel domain-containing protein n=1 Tax=Cercospora zeae-maydis SCOH1-5 TaxID=717836 RepID=A0A6A6EZY1_9PEZI|nr:hypothetical protein CERZMDRAFT_103108 [Cercospora zeae-maydis SCOH1-5]
MSLPSRLSRHDAERQTDGANAHYPPHSHAGLTTHLILAGELTITYPDDAEPRKETSGPGSRLQ